MPDKPVVSDPTKTPPSKLVEAPPKITFGRLLVLLGIVAAVSAFVFWLTCIRQPGVSYSSSKPVDPPPADSEVLPQQATTATVVQAGPTDEPIPPTDVADIPTKLRQHIDHLASTIGERNIKHIQQLNAAADYVESELKSFGFQPRRQTYQCRGVDCHNIDVEIVGSKFPQEIVIVGGHYDSAEGTPGANDNGSGTAATLVLAEHFADTQPERTLRFVAWTNEEPPYFQHRGEMGSWVYAVACRQRNEDIKAVLSLETMGYFTDAENSQHYPPPLNLLYPSTGNFVGFVANLSSRGLQRQAIKVFRENSEIPSEGAALPDAVQGVGWSDHWSFWQEDYVGIMVTDTAPFRYPHYHRPTDTPDKINYLQMAKVVDGLTFVIQDLVSSQSE